jgi:glycosyltransferase involved in cell wall biosynthesis
MAIGKPIIASDLDQIGEILSHKEDAYLVKAGDIDELAEAMKTLADDQSLRYSLEKKAREKVLNYYTWDKHVDRLLEKFRAVKNNIA